MEMFHLRYCVAVAENLSFSKAARQLHMATSPLSQRVRDLERDLGSVLFERDSRAFGGAPLMATVVVPAPRMSTVASRRVR